MTKHEFITELQARLSALPEGEVGERLNFYAEMIDDRIEDGSSEEEAVADLGSIDEIVSQIIADIPLLKVAGKAAKQRIKAKGRFKAWEIVLLCVGAPVWVSVLIALAASALAIYVSFWAVIVSLWAVFGSLVGCAVAGVAVGVVGTVVWSVGTGFVLIGAGVACAGLSVLTFFGCREATKGAVRLASVIALGIKRGVIKKESTV